MQILAGRGRVGVSLDAAVVFVFLQRFPSIVVCIRRISSYLLLQASSGSERLTRWSEPVTRIALFTGGHAAVVGPTHRVTALVVSDMPSAVDRLRAALSLHGLHCSLEKGVSRELAAQTVARLNPDLVLVLLPPGGSDPASMLCTLRSSTTAALVAVGEAVDSKVVLRAIRAGADDFLDESHDFDHELGLLARRLSAARVGQTPPCQMIGVVSAGGGCGASLTAVNLAAALSGHDRRCGLLDLDLRRGSLALLLDLKPKHSVQDLCQNLAHLDQVMMGQVFVRHISGLELLAASEAPDEADSVTAHAMAKVVELARERFSHLVVDLGDPFRGKQASIVRSVDQLVLVFRLDVVSLMQTKRAMRSLRQIGLDDGRVLLVANRCGQARELSARMAENSFGRKIAHFIPEDTFTVNTSLNLGSPAVLEAPSAKVSKAVQGLAERLISGGYGTDRKTKQGRRRWCDWKESVRKWFAGEAKTTPMELNASA